MLQGFFYNWHPKWVFTTIIMGKYYCYLKRIFTVIMTKGSLYKTSLADKHCSVQMGSKHTHLVPIYSI